MTNQPVEVPMTVVQNLTAAITAACFHTLSETDREKISIEMERQIRLFEVNPDRLGVWTDSDWASLEELGLTLCSMLTRYQES